MMMKMLKADPENLDLGNIKFGSIEEFDYVLTNESDELISVVALIVGCKSCTAAHVVGGGKIEPGASKKLHVTFTPGDTGKTLKGISILYKSPADITDGKELKVTFRAYVNE